MKTGSNPTSHGPFPSPHPNPGPGSRKITPVKTELPACYSLLIWLFKNTYHIKIFLLMKEFLVLVEILLQRQIRHLSPN